MEKTVLGLQTRLAVFADLTTSLRTKEIEKQSVLDQLNMRIQELETEKTQILILKNNSNQMNQLEQSRLQRLDQKVKELLQENQNLETKNSNLSSETQTLKLELEKTKQQLELTNNRVCWFDEEHNRKTTEFLQFTREKTKYTIDLLDQIQEQKQQNQILSKQCDSLNKNVEKLTLELQESLLQQRQNELKSLSLEQEYQAELSLIKKSNDANKKLAEEASNFAKNQSNQVTDAKNSAIILQKKLADSKLDFENLILQKDAHLNDLINQNLGFQSKIQELESQMGDFVEMAKVYPTSALLKAQNTKSKQELWSDAARGKLELSRAEKQIKTLESQLKQMLKEMEERAPHYLQLSKDFDELRQSNRQTLIKNTNLIKKINHLEQNIQQMETNNSESETEYKKQSIMFHALCFQLINLLNGMNADKVIKSLYEILNNKRSNLVLTKPLEMQDGFKTVEDIVMKYEKLNAEYELILIEKQELVQKLKQQRGIKINKPKTKETESQKTAEEEFFDVRIQHLEDFILKLQERIVSSEKELAIKSHLHATLQVNQEIHLDEKKHLKTTIDSLKETIQIFEQKSLLQTNTLQKYEREFLSLKTELSTLVSSSKQQKQENNDLKMQLKIIENSREQIIDEKSKLQMERDTLKRISFEIKTQMENQQNQLQLLMSQTHSKQESMETQIKVLSNKLSAPKTQIVEKIIHDSTQLDVLQQELNQKNTLIEELTQQKIELEQQYLQTNETNKELFSELDLLRNNQNSESNERDELLQKIQNLNEKIEQMINENSSKQRNEEDLIKKHLSCDAKIEALQNELEDTRLLHMKCVQELAKDFETIASLRKTLEEKTQMLDKETISKLEMEKELNSKHLDLQQLTLNHEQKIREFESKVENLNLQNKEMFGKLMDNCPQDEKQLLILLKSECNALLAEKEVMYLDFSRKISALELANEQLCLKLTQMNSNEESDDLKIQLEDLKTQLLILKESNNTLRLHHKRLQDQLSLSKQQIQQLHDQNVDIQKNNASQSAELVCAKDMLSRHEKDAKEWQQKYHQMISKYERIDPEQHKKLQIQLSQKEEECTELEQRRTNAIRKYNEVLKQSNARTEDCNSRLQKQQDEFEEERTNFEKLKQGILIEAEKLRQKLSQKDAEIMDNQLKLREKSSEIGTLKNRLVTMKMKQVSSSDQVEEMEEEEKQESKFYFKPIAFEDVVIPKRKKKNSLNQKQKAKGTLPVIPVKTSTEQ